MRQGSAAQVLDFGVVCGAAKNDQVAVVGGPAGHAGGIEGADAEGTYHLGQLVPGWSEGWQRDAVGGAHAELQHLRRCHPKTMLSCRLRVAVASRTRTGARTGDSAGTKKAGASGRARSREVGWCASAS